MAQGVKTGGRQKGTPNKTTALLKEAILLAAEQVGFDGEGTDGLTGYLRHVAKTDVKAYASLLGRVIPLQIDGSLEHSYVARMPAPVKDMDEWQKRYSPPTVQ